MIEPNAVLEGRYHVVELLAQGGMADVFRARDTTMDRDVAIKAFRVGAGDVRRFHGETRILAALDHPNLVRVFDAGGHEDQPYVVLELVAGPTLAHRLREGPLPDAVARRVGADLAAALAYVHAHNVVHRDVKPSNILLAADGRALLGDFGIALLLDATRLTAATETLGTAGYLAPEQVSGVAVTAAADVYALGLVLLETLTGRRAFGGTPQEVMMARLARAPSVPSDLPRPWPELLSSMTALEPAARPNAAAAAARLTGLDEGPPVIGGSPTPEHEADPTASRAAPSWTPSEEPTVVAQRTGILEPLVFNDPPTGDEPRRTRSKLPWLVGLAAMCLVALVLALATGDDDKPAADPRSESTSTTSVSTSATPPPPAVAERPAVSCTQFEAAKQAVDGEKRRIEQQYRTDKETRERLKKELEDQKQEIESEKQAAGC